MGKLSTPQISVLRRAKERSDNGWRIDFYDALRVGGNGKTLAALTAKGLLSKESYVGDSSVWSITPVGRAALARAEQEGK